MKSPAHSRLFLMALSLIALGACDTTHTITLTAPTNPPFQVIGEVQDDGCFLPPPAAACTPVAGARVEVMSGPEKGRAVMTDAKGRFDLGQLSDLSGICLIACDGYSVYISASKPGWTPSTKLTGPLRGGVTPETLRIATEPHVLWSTVYLPGTMPAPRAAGVRVEILDGPNAGKVTFTRDDGIYIFENMRTSPGFAIEFSKDGYQTGRVTSSGLTQNGGPYHQLVAK
jgi:hypothetical protein